MQSYAQVRMIMNDRTGIVGQQAKLADPPIQRQLIRFFQNPQRGSTRFWLPPKIIEHPGEYRMRETEVRDRKHPLKVVVSSQERELIESNAKASGLSVSAFLRSLGTGHQPSTRFDREALRELIKLHADQGRLGGLLKLWLVERKGEGANTTDVRSMLQQIESLQMELARIVMAEKKRL